jgi:hypothetical protein
MRRDGVKAINVEIRVGPFVRQAGYRKLKWYIREPQFCKKLPI